MLRLLSLKVGHVLILTCFLFNPVDVIIWIRLELAISQESKRIESELSAVSGKMFENETVLTNNGSNAEENHKSTNYEHQALVTSVQTSQ